MGMFDSVMFRCPECGNRIEQQSKAGDCLLHTFESHEVPLGIADSVAGNLIYCENCDSHFSIGYVHIPQAYIGLRLNKC